MAQHGKDTALLVDQYNLSAFFNSSDWGRNCDTHETTTYGASAKTYQSGLKDGSLSVEGLYDAGVGASDAVLSAALGASGGQLISLLLQGSALMGGRAKIAKALETGYDISNPTSDIVSVSAEFQPDGGLWGGVLLSPLTAKTATGNGTTQDDAAATTEGWVANLHCTAVAGTTPTNTVKVQHSTDGATWVDLGTFTQLTAAGAQQLSGAGTVNRYVRTIHTIAGTGGPSFTFAVTFARK